MGTRGFIGFKDKEGKIHGWYNHYDSYPSYLGQRIVQKLATLTTEQITEFFTKKLAILEGKALSEKDAERIYESTKDLFEPDANVDFTENKTFEVLSAHDFYKDGLFCEYSYIYNVKTNRLELYAGFGKKASKGIEDWFYDSESGFGENKRYYIKKKGSIKYPQTPKEALESLYKRFPGERPKPKK